MHAPQSLKDMCLRPKSDLDLGALGIMATVGCL